MNRLYKPFKTGISFKETQKQNIKKIDKYLLAPLTPLGLSLKVLRTSFN